MSDAEILDDGETLVEYTPLCKVSEKTGYSFDDIIAFDKIRCIRCGHEFRFSISRPPEDEELLCGNRPKIPISQIEFDPYVCPYCGMRIVGLTWETNERKMIWSNKED